jgi:hypothetical protein
VQPPLFPDATTHVSQYPVSVMGLYTSLYYTEQRKVTFWPRQLPTDARSSWGRRWSATWRFAVAVVIITFVRFEVLVMLCTGMWRHVVRYVGFSLGSRYLPHYMVSQPRKERKR